MSLWFKLMKLLWFRHNSNSRAQRHRVFAVWKKILKEKKSSSSTGRRVSGMPHLEMADLFFIYYLWSLTRHARGSQTWAIRSLKTTSRACPYHVPLQKNLSLRAVPAPQVSPLISRGRIVQVTVNILHSCEQSGPLGWVQHRALQTRRWRGACNVGWC